MIVAKADVVRSVNLSPLSFNICTSDNSITWVKLVSSALSAVEVIITVPAVALISFWTFGLAGG